LNIAFFVLAGLGLLAGIVGAVGGAKPVSAADREAVHQLFLRIQQEFAGLSTSLREEVDDHNTYLVLEFPEQQGVRFPILLSFFDDSLLMQGGGHPPKDDYFAWEVFPCTRPEVRERFAEQVRGILSGDLRVMVEFVKHKRRTAVIQHATETGWEPVVHFAERPESEVRILQNR